MKSEEKLIKPYCTVDLDMAETAYLLSLVQHSPIKNAKFHKKIEALIIEELNHARDWELEYIINS